jgi:hypothetical protein
MVIRPRRRRLPTSRPGEDALLARLRNLEPSAWRLLYDQAYPVLSTYAMLRLGTAALAGEAIRDAMIKAVEVLPSEKLEGDTLRLTLLGFVAQQIAATGRLRPEPDPSAITALPPGRRRLRDVFAALPSGEQDLLALVVAGATLEQAASAIRWDPNAAANALSRDCRMLAPSLSVAQVIEELRAAFPGRPWEPRLEDQQALRAAVVGARDHGRRRRVFGYLSLAAGASMIVLGLLSNGVLPRSVRMLAYSAGLPVQSPRVLDVERDIAALSDAVRAGNPANVDLAARALTSAFDALNASEMDRVRSDVEAELLRARQFLEGGRAQTGRPYPAPVTGPPVNAASPHPPAPTTSPPENAKRKPAPALHIRPAIVPGPRPRVPAPAPAPAPPAPAPAPVGQPSPPQPGTPAPSQMPAPNPTPSPSLSMSPTPTPSRGRNPKPRPRPSPTRSGRPGPSPTASFP